MCCCRLIDCPSGKYGYKCLQTCNCLNGGTCDERIGCVCASGYSGYDCGTGEICIYIYT